MHSNSAQLLEYGKSTSVVPEIMRTDKVKHKKHFIIVICLILLLLMAVLNVISWLSTDFSDWYAENVYPLINNTISRLTGLFPFSVGEVLIILGVSVLLIGPAAFVICMIVLRKRRQKVLRFTAVFLLVVFTYIFVTETMNCFIMYHCTPFSEKHMNVSEEHDYHQLIELCNTLIEKANYYSELVERDENGKVITPDNLNDIAIQSMINLSNEYKLLSGYYPQPKKILFSGFMTQLNLKGVYYPFTLEANYNKRMYPVNFPDTICHEMSHLKGFMQEDEANFISFLACINSDSNYFKYSGYIAALGYTYSQVAKLMKYDGYSDIQLLQINELVIKDDIFVEYEYLEKLEEEAVIPTEVISEASEAAIDTSLKLNGVSDGSKSYGRMVDLLLSYYYD
jgi:hypothetical protein